MILGRLDDADGRHVQIPPLLVSGFSPHEALLDRVELGEEVSGAETL